MVAALCYKGVSTTLKAPDTLKDEPSVASESDDSGTSEATPDLGDTLAHAFPTLHAFESLDAIEPTYK